MNCIQQNTKSGKELRVHQSNENGAPICGGGNSARSAQWQEVLIEANCARCRTIVEQKNTPMKIGSPKSKPAAEISNVNIHIHGSTVMLGRWMMDIKVNGVRAQHHRCLRDYVCPSDAINSARHAVNELVKKEGK